jgi:hypothetical protein
VGLRPFAAAPAALRGIRVRVMRPAPGQLVLDYELEGDLTDLRIPDRVAGGTLTTPTDGLWRHTCMELFVSQAPGGAYLEFNLAPSGQWAAYRFSGYRAQMAPLTGIRPPRLELRTQADQLLLSADVALPAEFGATGLRLGLTTVVEDARGTLSYWALSHAGDRPDFHQPDSFGFEI